MSNATEPRRRISRRTLRLVSYSLAAIAAASLAYPFATGAYTAWRQDSLRRQAEETQRAVALTAEETTGSPSAEDRADPFRDWRTQDFAYFRGQKAGEPFGRLVIPRLDLDVVVIKGSEEASLKSGPGWIDTTDYPGRKGNAGISGHRTTYAAPFRHLERLAEGDLIYFHSPYRVYRYRVFRTLEVQPDDGSVMAYTEDPTLTLSTCHPPYSARRRLIVQARLEATKRLFLPGSE